MTTNQAQQAVRQALLMFEQLASSTKAPTETITEFLQTLAKATSAIGATTWMPADQSFQTFQPIGLIGQAPELLLDDSNKPTEAISDIIRKSWQDGQVTAAPPNQDTFAGHRLSNTTQFFIPVESAGRILSIIHVIYDETLDPSIYREYAGFAQHCAKFLAQYLNRRQSEVSQVDAKGYKIKFDSLHLLLKQDSPEKFIHELANQARPLLSALRCCVIGHYTKKPQIVFSDVVNVNKKAVLVRSMETLAQEVINRDAPLSFTLEEPLSEQDIHLSVALDPIFEAGHADAVCLTPIRHNDKIIAVLICEYETTELASKQAPHQQDFCHITGPALQKCIDWQTRPLRRTSNFLASIRDNPKVATTRTLVTMVIVGIIIYLLFFMQVTINIRGDARLEPAALAIISAPIDGRIEEVLVKPNQKVTKGQIIATLEKTDYDLEVAELERALAQEEIKRKQALIEGKRSDWYTSELRIQQFKLRIQAANRNLKKCDIESPMDGIILNDDLRVLNGMTVTEGKSLINVADLSKFELVIDVPEQDISLIQNQLKKGNYVPVEFLSHADSDHIQTAKITSLNKLAPTSNLDEKQIHHVYRITVEIELKNISTELALAKRTGRAKLSVGEGSVAYKYLRNAWHFVQVKLLF